MICAAFLNVMLLQLASLLILFMNTGKMNIYTALLILLLSLLMILRLFGRVYERPGLGIAAGAMYGLSLAGFHSVMLIRMYMMVAFWCLTVLTLCLEKLIKSGGCGQSVPLRQ